MRAHILFAFLIFILNSPFLAQSQDPTENNYHFYPVYAEGFAETASNANNKDIRFTGYGGEARFASGTDETKRIQVCGLWSTGIGFGRNSEHSKNYLPFLVSLGFSGSCKLGEKQSAGLVYDFAGIYGYSQVAFAGSQIGVIYRNRIVQAEFSRAGIGFLKGAFTRVDNSSPVFTASVGAWVSDRFQINIKHVVSDWSGMKQTRLGIRWIF
jgi:hypothetical protein